MRLAGIPDGATTPRLRQAEAGLRGLPVGTDWTAAGLYAGRIIMVWAGQTEESEITLQRSGMPRK